MLQETVHHTFNVGFLHSYLQNACLFLQLQILQLCDYHTGHVKGWLSTEKKYPESCFHCQPIRVNPEKILPVVNSHVPVLALSGFCVPGDLNDGK